MQKLHALTGIRIVAACWVVLFHLTEIFSFGLFQPLVQKGYLGVDLFFILSGFILSYVHQAEFTHFSPKLAGRFILLRWARVMPVHYFVLLVMFLYFALESIVTHSPFPEPVANMYQLVLHIFNIHAWGITSITAWNGPSWSVSAEWFAYLAFPLLCPLVFKLRSVASNLLLMLGCFLLLATFQIGMHLPSMDWTYAHGLIRILAEFPIGCALYNIFKQIKPPGWLLPTAAIGLIAGIYFHVPDIVSLVSISLLIFGLSTNTGMLTHRLMIHLGEVSYAVYMVHAFLLVKFQKITQMLPILTAGPSVQNTAYFLLMVGVILLAAELVYRYIELPARNRIRQLLSPSRLSPPAMDRLFTSKNLA